MSIVVVVFNAGLLLPPLLDSIFAHRTLDTEVIVIDGGSSDGTVELLRNCGAAIDFWLSEPDEGIYDAMNKGIQAATGKFIFHLNAGDRLLKVPSAMLRRCETVGIDVASFQVLMDRRYMFRPRTGLIMKLDNAWHHQGTFYRRVKHPGYNTRFRVFGDFDLNQRLMISGTTVALFEEVVAEHTTDGVSSRAPRQEIHEIIRKNFGGGYLILAMLRFRINAVRRWVKMWRQPPRPL